MRRAENELLSTYPSPPSRDSPAKFVMKSEEPSKGLFLMMSLCLSQRFVNFWFGRARNRPTYSLSSISSARHLHIVAGQCMSANAIWEEPLVLQCRICRCQKMSTEDEHLDQYLALAPQSG